MGGAIATTKLGSETRGEARISDLTYEGRDGQPVSACTYLAYEARDRDVLTVEGLAPSPQELHPLQRAFIAENAFQCGFCTSGMLMSAKSLLDSKPDADEAEIIAYMEGNLCRCTGYKPILVAIQRAQAELQGRPWPSGHDGHGGR